MSISTQDLQPPFDPTGYTSISGAQLLQFITGTFPGVNAGFVVTSSGTTSAPSVPPANVTTKWQQYIWQHIYTDTNSIGVFVWNPNQSSPLGPTYLNWQPIASAAVPAGSIQGFQIAANTITAGNIANVNWSSIVNAPTSLPPNGAAGGVLSGTYPNPSIAVGAITSAMIAQNAITGGATGDLAIGANGVDITQNIKVPASSNLGSPSGASAGAPVANDRIVVGVGATAFATVRKTIDALAEPTTPFTIPQVDATGAGWQYSGVANGSSFGRILQKYVSASKVQQNTTTNLASTGTAPTTSNTALCSLFDNTPTSGLISFTPISASSTIDIEVVLQLSASTASSMLGVLFNGTTALATAIASVAGSNICTILTIPYSFASPGTSAIDFYVYFAGSAGTTYINSYSGISTGVASLLTSSVTIIERV